jgi:glutathione peroxidase
LEETFKGEGLHVLGFLSNDFGNQGGDDGQVDACNDQYGVKFDQFAIDHVSGATPEPVFAWLLGQQEPGPDGPMEPDWNFEKYLISRDGTVVAHWDGPTAPPNDANDNFDANPIVVAIKAELAK